MKITRHYTYILFSVLLFAFAFAGTPVHAGEIHYGSLIDQYNDTLLLQYKGPSGTEYFTCSIDGDCDTEGEKEPNMFPTLLGAKNYPKSTDGTLGVKLFPIGNSVFYFLYDISGNAPEKIALIPFTKTGATVRFAKNNTAVLFQDGRTYTRYDIGTKKLKTLTLPHELSFVSISPDATYVTGYNYNTLRHELWRFADGKKLESPSSMQSYLEFSEDEAQLAFLEDVKGYKTLFTMDARDLGVSNPDSLTQVTKPKTETEDYLFVEDTLYFMANVDGPLEWDLFSYRNGDREVVDRDVSYGDFLKRVDADGKSYLAYLKTTGKHTNVVLVSSDSDPVTIAPAGYSSVSTDVERTVKKYADRNGVLLSPEDPQRRPALFIWMHGGPQRQVAKSYHPYLSYAVYDELLERITEAGNYVYKIDYTGSSGYGADFRKALTMHVGDVEMRDIEHAVDEITDDIDDIDEVYLIGNSYGGYMALRALVDFPEKIDGVISINGVSDWYGLIQQIPSSPFSKVFDGSPDSHNLDAYFQASVFSGLDELDEDSKVFVVWGENDATVPTWQSTKYIDFLKSETDVTLETLSFPDEDHILRKRKNLDKLCESIADFADVREVECEI